LLVFLLFGLRAAKLLTDHPLSWRGCRKTDVAHNCPKKKNGQTLQALPATKTTAAIIAKPDTIIFAETWLEILTDYIRLKTKEQGEVTAATSK
jgi:hypothetical protein